MVGDTLADMGMGKSANLGATVGVLSGVGNHIELHPFADYLVYYFILQKIILNFKVEHVGKLLPFVLNHHKDTTPKFAL